MSTRKPPRRPTARKRKPRVMVPFRERANASSMCMYPHEAAAELLVSERQIRYEMSTPVERGGLRCICLGDPSSPRPRRIIHRSDFALFIEFKRGKISLKDYIEKLKDS